MTRNASTSHQGQTSSIMIITHCLSYGTNFGFTFNFVASVLPSCSAYSTKGLATPIPFCDAGVIAGSYRLPQRSTTRPAPLAPRAISARHHIARETMISRILITARLSSPYVVSAQVTTQVEEGPPHIIVVADKHARYGFASAPIHSSKV